MGTFFTYVNYLDENLLYMARPASVGPMHWGGRVQKKPPQLQKMLHGDQSLSPWSLEPVLSTPCLLFATMGLRFCPWPVPLGQASGSSAERGPAGILVRKGCWACRPREAEAATCSLEAPVYVFGPRVSPLYKAPSSLPGRQAVWT